MAGNIPVYSTVTFSDYLDSKETRIPQDGDNFVLSTPSGLQKVDTVSLYNNIKTTLDIPESLNSIKDGEGESATIQGKIDENIASGQYSFASGNGTCASAANAHAEGYRTKALAINSHTEGNSSQVRFGAVGSHAEGAGTLITGGIGAHAEGRATTATATASHSGGDHTIARGVAQTAIGKYNIEDTNNKYAFIIGNGTSETASNAFAVDWEGNAEISKAIKTPSLILNGAQLARVGGDNINDGLVNAITTSYSKPRFFAIGVGDNSAGWHDGETNASTSLLATTEHAGLMSTYDKNRLSNVFVQRLYLAKGESEGLNALHTYLGVTGESWYLMHIYNAGTSHRAGLISLDINKQGKCSTVNFAGSSAQPLITITPTTKTALYNNNTISLIEIKNTETSALYVTFIGAQRPIHLFDSTICSTAEHITMLPEVYDNRS